MLVSFGNQGFEFVPWRPEHGQVFQSAYAFDCETELIDNERDWLVPPYVIGAAFDGTRGYFLQRKDVTTFFKLHAIVPVIIHNAVFDLAVIHQLAPSLDIYQLVQNRQVWDTQLLHRLYALGTNGDTAGKKGESTLEHCAKRYLNIELPKDVQDPKGSLVRHSYGQWLNKPAVDIDRIYLEYLAKDVIATKGIYEALQDLLRQILISSAGIWGYVSDNWLQEQITQWGPQTHHIQLKASIVLKEISRNGLHLNTDKSGDLKAILELKVNELREQLRQHGYLPCGKGSNKSLQEVLKRLNRLQPGLQFPRTEKTDQFATSFDALQEFASTVPFINVLLEYRGTDKLLNSFMDKMNKGVLHPSFNALVKTGRTSSFGEINAQNLPKDPRIRSCIIPSPGKVFLDCDYKTIEMATLAQACMRQFNLHSSMAEAINQGKDLHRLLAARVKKINESEVTDEDRGRAKAINFGKPGGMGNKTLQQYAKVTFGIELNEEEVALLSVAWHDQFPEMRQFLKDNNDIGLEIARMFDLTLASFFNHTGQQWCRNGQDPHEPCPFLGGMFLKTMKEQEPTTGKGRRYTDIEMDYFWTQLESHRQSFSAKAQRDLQTRQPSLKLQREVMALSSKAGVYTLTGRLRAKASYTARHNTVFQGLAADGAKLALWDLWRSGYRIVNFIHDQVLVEIPQDCDYEAESRKVRQLMVEGMKAVVPDVRVEVPKPYGSPVKKSWGDNCIGDTSFCQIDTAAGTVLCG